MPAITDMELLRDYRSQDSEKAFATLVERHISLVYSAALRHVGGAAQAEEITQAVFIILARKAGGLRADIVLESWLYETTRLTALGFRRGERRRQAREQEAYMQSIHPETDENSNWNQLAPLLDDALARLGRKDREAVVLRFFKEKTTREVAAALKITEAAAQRRVHRAVEKLRKIFIKHGVTLTATAIAGAVSANSVQAAPVGLVKIISAVAVAKGAAATASTLTLVKGALKLMAWTKMKTVIVAGVAVLLAAGTTTVTIKEIQEHNKHPQPATPAARPASEAPSVYAGRWPSVFHAEQIRLSGGYPIQTLEIYAKLTNANLEISPEVKFLKSGIYWTNHQEMTSPQVVDELEKVLRSQAGVVIQHMDATHITVTYDASAADKSSK